jgi:TrkA family protein/RyR domain-containing protein
MVRTRNFIPVVIAVLLVIALAIAALAHSHFCGDDWQCWAITPIEILLGSFQPARSNSPTELLLVTQLGGKAILLIGAFFSTMSIVASAVRHDFRTALARRMKNHVVVCGLGETGMQCVRNMRAAGEKIVVIDRADDTTGNGAVCDQLGIPLIKGDATGADILSLAGALHARTIVVCTGDDVSNMDVALQIKELAKTRRQPGLPPIVVLAEMRTQWLFSRLVNHDRHPLGSDEVDVRLFNNHENTARLLLRRLRLPPAPEIDGGAFVVVGFGLLGQQITLHLIRSALAVIGSNPKIIVFEQGADEHQRKFLRTYPAAAKLAEVSFVEANISPDNPEAWATVENTINNIPLLGAAVCFDDDETGLYAGLSMRRLLDNVSRIHVPIFLRLGQARYLAQFATMMESLEGQAGRFEIFGGLQQLVGTDILIRGELDALAEALHAQYLDSREPASQSPLAGRSWNMLPETLKMSNRRRADNLPFLLAQAGLHMRSSAQPVPLELDGDEIELLARLEHRRWSIERRLAGFSYGEVRSEFPPRHDLLVDWEQLPEAERARNRKDFADLPKVLKIANFELWREHKIAATDTRISAALSTLELAIAGKETGCVVIADIDAADGRKAAALALELPNPVLWLVSSDYPLQFKGLQQLGKIFENATGWVTREQVHGG